MANDDDTEPVEPVPDVCCVCGRPAGTNYDDREDMPSCGSMRCELQMQYALDYMADAGDR